MMHKAWSGLEEVPYCFSMSSVEVRGPTEKNFADFHQAFPGFNSHLNLPMAMKWRTKLEVAQKEPYYFSRSSIKF